MQKLLAPSGSNYLLWSLSTSDLARLEPHLEPVDLPVRRSIEAPNQRIGEIFFPVSGMVSVVATSAEVQIEVGIIGREGMTGISVVLGETSSPHNCFVQIAGEGLKIGVDPFQKAVKASSSLQWCFLRYARAFMLQTAETALANGRCTIEQRLARWLLMSQDRLEGDIPLTHEFLSIMLGVRRPGVTVALESLEGAQAIRNVRSRISIRDRAKLEEMAKGIYTPFQAMSAAK